MTGYGEGLYGGGLYGGGTLGIDLLPNQLTGAFVAVEIAWGADLTDTTGAGWSWIDVTRDVRQAEGINISLGRADEASTSQPASLTLRVDNADFAYSLGGASPNYPNVKKNTPIRVRVDPGDTNVAVLFQGYITGFTPSWDSLKADIPVVTISANGALRRIIQGRDSLRSALYRHITLNTSPREYWPLEDGKSSLQGSSAVAGRAPAQFEPVDSGGTLYGKVAWAGDTDNPATEQAVQVSAGGQLSMQVNPAGYTDYWVISWAMRYTSGSGAAVYFRTTQAASQRNYYGIWYTDGSVEFYVTDDSGLSSTLFASFVNGEPTEWDNIWHTYTMEVTLAGSTSVIYIYRDNVLVDFATTTPGIFGKPMELEFRSFPDPGGTEDPVSIGHVAIWNADPGLDALQFAAEAHRGEQVLDRLTRLCTEESVDLATVGVASGAMGPQLPTSFINLIRECEAVDQGILYDGVGPGLQYVTRDERENVASSLTIAADELREPFQPTDDDQRTRNRVTASSPTSSKYTYEDRTGPLGTEAIGVYDSSLEVNVEDNELVGGYAEWAVHLGTVEGYRYPAVSVSIAATPTLAVDVVNIKPSDRLQITDIQSVFPALPEGEINLLLEGVSMTVKPYEWDVTFKCSPYEPWVIGTLAEDTGDTSDTLIYLDAHDAFCDSPTGHPAGNTSLFTFSPSGTKWSENSDDYPLLLDVAGNQVRATSCSTAGGFSQDFVVDPLPAAVEPNTPITLWDPQILGQ